MTHVTKTIASSVAAAIVAVAILCFPASASAIAPVKVSECGLGKPTTQPKSMTLTCADAGVVLNHLTWWYWGEQVATAVGTSTENDCKPNCAAGHFHDYGVVVTLWRVKSNAAGGSQFTRATVTYTGKHPGRHAVVYDLRLYSPES